MDKKTYEAPAVNEVGSVEGLTLGGGFDLLNRDHSFYWGIIPKFRGS